MDEMIQRARRNVSKVGHEEKTPSLGLLSLMASNSPRLLEARS